jgi:PAS domain S-box-containing protein
VITLPAPLDEQIFRRMADMSSRGLYVTDFQGRFRYVNQRALDPTGYTWRELQGMTTSEIDPTISLELYQQAVIALDGPMPLLEIAPAAQGWHVASGRGERRAARGQGEKYVFGVVRDISAQAKRAGTRTSRHRLPADARAERQPGGARLHDDVGQALATVGGLLRPLERVSAAIPTATRPALDATLATIRDITASVARIVRDYHPADLSDAGLTDTIRQHAQQFAECHALHLDVVVDTVSGVLDRAQELHLYRITQEALANVARHARCIARPHPALPAT